MQHAYTKIIPTIMFAYLTFAFLAMYQLCGDNIDKNVKRRYFRADSKPNTRSLHYFHYYVVKDRVNFIQLGEEPNCCLQSDRNEVAHSLLPTPTDDMSLRENVCVLISRILYNHLPFFEHTFDGVITWHIEHQYYEQMCQKSEWASYANY